KRTNTKAACRFAANGVKCQGPKKLLCARTMNTAKNLHAARPAFSRTSSNTKWITSTALSTPTKQQRSTTSMTKNNFAFFGTSHIAVYVLEALAQSNQVPALVVTLPPRAKG